MVRLSPPAACSRSLPARARGRTGNAPRGTGLRMGLQTFIGRCGGAPAARSWPARWSLPCGAGVSSWPALRAPTTPPAPSAAAYVGAETCASCHAAEAGLWHESQHAHAMEHATEDDCPRRLRRCELREGRRHHDLLRDGDGLRRPHRRARRRAPGLHGQVHLRRRSPLQQYLVELPGGRLQALPIAWDTRPAEEGGQRWFHLYPDETIPAGDELHWTGRLQNWNTMCADCHSTNVVRNYDLATDTYGTTYSEINVACESCHGPGSQHVDWANKAEGWEAMADMGLVVALDERKDAAWILDPETGNSRREPPRTTMREIDTCAVCHSRRGPVTASAIPGAPIGDSYRVVSPRAGPLLPRRPDPRRGLCPRLVPQSRMFHEGVTCSDCHEPHSLDAPLREERRLHAVPFGRDVRHARPSPPRDRTPPGPSASPATCRSGPTWSSTRAATTASASRGPTFRRRSARPTPATPAMPTRRRPGRRRRSPPGTRTRTRRFQQFGRDASRRRARRTRARATACSRSPKTRARPGIARASALDRLDRVPTPEAFGSLVGLLHDPDPLVRRSAAIGLRDASRRRRARRSSTLPRIRSATCGSRRRGCSPRCRTRRWRPRPWCLASS